MECKLRFTSLRNSKSFIHSCIVNLSMFSIQSFIFCISLQCGLTQADEDITFSTSSSSLDNDFVFHQIEGKVIPPDPKPADWHWLTRILVDGGKKLAFLKVTVYKVTILKTLNMQFIMYINIFYQYILSFRKTTHLW